MTNKFETVIEAKKLYNTNITIHTVIKEKNWNIYEEVWLEYNIERENKSNQAYI